ncbi:uncharacterized protein LOC128726228 [Anopheles nili]|uniref:uncharacterized protein LOC128726228 n=1 Tax=Anopheles nili TaxID=185578 RepID=UPI00237C30AD|nr:uncharacterized protein LOC128726228 [Anopheles nili]
MGLGSSVEALPYTDIRVYTAPVCEPIQAKNPCPTSKGKRIPQETMTNGAMFQSHYTANVFPSETTTGSTVPMGSELLEYGTAHSTNWQSIEIAPSTTRQSRSRHRHLMDSRLNNSYADSEAMMNTADACINDIRRVEENLRMESRMLSENNNIPMARCSTPSPAYCFHCDHDHRERCCLYIGDTPEDGPYYSRWKRNLENPSVRPQYIPKIPEAVSGNSTPFWFPAYTYTKPETIKQKMMEKHPPPPAVWMRQFYYPIVGYGREYQLMNQATLEPPTPYQQYLQQHQQELYRMCHQQYQPPVQYREPAACRHGRKCEGLGVSGVAYVQQQYHNVHSLPVSAGDYGQQVHPSAYYYPGTYYNGYHHLPQQPYAPAGYAPPSAGTVPVYHDGYLHSAHYPIGYPPAPPTLPPREPTPPLPTTPTPMWQLFCQKISRKFPDRNKKASPTKGRSPSKNFRHNPTTIVPTIFPAVAPDHLPPKYSNIDLPHMQYHAGSRQPTQHYTRSMLGQHSLMGQTVATHAPYYGLLPPPPMADSGMCFVSPTTINV